MASGSEETNITKNRLDAMCGVERVATASHVNPTRQGGIKQQRNEGTREPVEVIEISSDEEEATGNSSNDKVDLELLVKILTKELGEAKRVQEKAESLEPLYDELMQEASSARMAQKEAEQIRAHYEQELDECQKQLSKFKETCHNIEEDTTCDICNETMWYPFLLPECRHIFCEKCIQHWLAHILDEHRQTTMPPFNWYQLIRILEEVTEVIALFERITVAMDGPEYSCPQCQEQVRSRPVWVYTMKLIARNVASIQGKSKSADANQSNAQIWDVLFPFRIP
ncbi:hypothetical protein IW261DRAFT_1428397 [Armillaria novae-zelandiae]|uniref:RING-type domain-containing protein n=1 Tax=Armillaria novae-zelandiae TaxID=153914 RepID=A0AA39N9I1_9AGAR|nr:hypothetical protein IW261DRAFT_1428397 [Armillaria novae-zelandiae]